MKDNEHLNRLCNALPLSTQEIENALNAKSVDVVRCLLVREDFALTDEQILKVMTHPDKSVRKWAGRRAEFKPTKELIDLGMNDFCEFNRYEFSSRKDWEYTTDQIKRGIEDNHQIVRACFIERYPLKREQITRLLRLGLESEVILLLNHQDIQDKDMATLLKHPFSRVKEAAIRHFKVLPDSINEDFFKKANGMVKCAILQRMDFEVTEELKNKIISEAHCSSLVAKVLLERNDFRITKEVFEELKNQVNPERLSIWNPYQMKWNISQDGEALLALVRDKSAAWSSEVEAKELSSKFDKDDVPKSKKVL